MDDRFNATSFVQRDMKLKLATTNPSGTRRFDILLALQHDEFLDFEHAMLPKLARCPPATQLLLSTEHPAHTHELRGRLQGPRHAALYPLECLENSLCSLEVRTNMDQLGRQHVDVDSINSSTELYFEIWLNEDGLPVDQS